MASYPTITSVESENTTVSVVENSQFQSVWAEQWSRDNLSSRRLTVHIISAPLRLYRIWSVRGLLPNL